MLDWGCIIFVHLIPTPTLRYGRGAYGVKAKRQNWKKIKKTSPSLADGNKPGLSKVFIRL